MLFDNIRLVEQRDEWLVGGLYQQELQWVPVVRDALEGAQNSVEKSTAGNFMEWVP